MKNQEEEIAGILDATSDGFFAVDRTWTILRVNTAHEKVSQLPRSQQVGCNLLQLFFSAPAAQKTKYWAAYNRAMQERVPVYFEDFYEPLGVWTSGNAYPTAEGGLSVFYRDVTAQKNAERQRETEHQKLEALFAGSPIAIALLQGPKFIFEMLNERWAGLVSPRDYLGRCWAEVYHELAPSPILDRLTEVLETGRDYHVYEMAFRIKGPKGDSGLRYYDISEVRICDSDGQPYGVLCYTLDVTERVRARQLLEESELRLQNAVRARDIFLGIASHELKTPLTSWSLQAQMSHRTLQKHGATAFTPEKISQLIESSVVQVRRLGRLVDDMLDVARIASGNLSINVRLVNLSLLVVSSVEAITPLLSQASCETVLQVEPSVMASIDPTRIEQVVCNLLTNCIKYAPARPVHVSLSASGRTATLTVRDHGPGIPQSMRTRVFERFERLTSASEVSGLGLGLHITKKIIQAHGGTIGLSQPDGLGAAFIMTIPLRAACEA